MKLTSFTFYKDTLFTDMQNTVHFNSDSERDEWFNTYFDSDHKIVLMMVVSQSLNMMVNTTSLMNLVNMRTRQKL